MRLSLIFFLLLTACATRMTVPDAYSERIEDLSSQSKKTVVYFLIDGLAVSTLKNQLTEGKLPNIRRHFLGPGQTFRQAHSIFPSLTYPNISSLLHESPVHLTGALGNSMITDGHVISFESVTDRPLFSQQMKGHTVFSRLSEKGLRSVSLDYGLGVDATVSSDILDLKAGIALQFQNYLYLDEKRIDSLKLLLFENKPEAWPGFIFIHLVGLDFLSHQKGPRSQEALDYLDVLDEKLASVFEILQKAERSNHKAISILSADHGFRPQTTERVRIEPLIEKMDAQLSVVNEGRMAALYYPRDPAQTQLAQWSSKLFQNHAVEIVAYRKGDKVRILSRTRDVTFQYRAENDCPERSLKISVQSAASHCPHQLPPVLRDLFYPFFIENLALYFQAEKRPDLIVIPRATAAFLETEVGFHGGPTPEETFVPLLMRNAVLKKSSDVPAQWELLQFL